MDSFSISFLTNPQDVEELIQFYFSWILILFAVHMLLDKVSQHTNKDNWRQLRNKISELHTAASVTSSILLGFVMLNGFKSHPLFENDLMLIPLVLSVITGVVVGFGSLIPKPVLAAPLLPSPQNGLSNIPIHNAQSASE